MTRTVSDSDSVRRQNRGLVLGALRENGPQSRTALAGLTGLSNASVTAIMQDLLAQGLVAELAAPDRLDIRLRGRPATLVGFRRDAAYVALFEIDVNRARLSLVDYSGILVDRLEVSVTPETFRDVSPDTFFVDRLAALQTRNPATSGALRRIAISVQGIMDRDGNGLKWSPIAHLSGTPFAQVLAESTGLPVSLHKRGRLLADGARWLDANLQAAAVATIFVGSTVAMGISQGNRSLGRGIDGATEFGHMNHMPNGALCRCGSRGCIEAYAADYGVLRTAYSVPEHAHPAAAVPAQQYESLIQRAENGDRTATHGFNLAGRALGHGLSRMMTLFDPTHILIVGPGARALDLMRQEITAALDASLVCRVNGKPEILAHRDETEPIFKGLTMRTLNDLDQVEFASLASAQTA